MIPFMLNNTQETRSLIPSVSGTAFVAKSCSMHVDVVGFAQVYWGTLHGISRLLLDGVYTQSSSVAQLCEAAADTLWQRLEPR